jgi:hypothetical protein
MNQDFCDELARYGIARRINLFYIIVDFEDKNCYIDIH